MLTSHKMYCIHDVTSNCRNKPFNSVTEQNDVSHYERLHESRWHMTLITLISGLTAVFNTGIEYRPIYRFSELLWWPAAQRTQALAKLVVLFRLRWYREIFRQ